MKPTCGHHILEFKREAVALVQKQGYSSTAAGRSLGVSGGLIGRWKDELENHATGAFPGHGQRTAEQQRIHELFSDCVLLSGETFI